MQQQLDYGKGRYDMNITTVASPIYSRYDNSTIDAEVSFDNGKTYPYTSSSEDDAPYGQQLWADLISGKYGTVAPYIAPST